MCAAPVELHGTWESPEEREQIVPSISTLADTFITARTPWPQTVARGTFFVFGPVATFARLGLAQGAGPPPLLDLIAGLAAADVVPHVADSETAFSSVVLPAWRRAFPAYAAEWADTPLGAAMPGPRKDVAEHPVHDAAVALLNANVGLGKLRQDVLALPGATAANAFLGRPVWTKILQVLGKRARNAGPTCDPPRLGEFRAYSPSDDYERLMASAAGVWGIPKRLEKPRLDSALIKRVRAIYREMDPTRRFTATHRGGDYTRGIPPQGKRVRRPTKLSGPAVKARTLWLHEVYALYVHGFLAMSLRVAHLEFLAAFYVAPGSPSGRRTRNALLRLSVDWGFRRGPSAMLDQLFEELTHPAVVYTHPATVDEARCWVLCALEQIYAASIATARIPVALDADAVEADRLVKQWARMYSATLAETVLGTEDIARILSRDGKTLSTAWLDEVKSEWTALHAADAMEASTEADVTAWLESLQVALTEANVLAAATTMPTMQDVLNRVAGIAWGRFFMATFHEQHPPTNAAGEPVDVVAETARITSIPYALSLGHLAARIAQTTELEDFLDRVWLPITATRSSPEVLYATQDVHTALHVVNETDAIAAGEDDRIVARAAGAPWPHPAAVGDVDVNGVVRFLFSEQRAVLAGLNWNAGFFVDWARRNTKALRGRLAYVARLDAYELDAGFIDLRQRGDVVRMEYAFTASSLERAIFVAPVERWPLYKEWTRVRVEWRVHAQIGEGGRYNLVYEHGLDEHAVVLGPPEIRGVSILAAIREMQGGPIPLDTLVEIECIVQGSFVTARPAATTEDTRATRCCLFTVLSE